LEEERAEGVHDYPVLQADDYDEERMRESDV